MSAMRGSAVELEFARIRAALHPLDDPPGGSPWNLRDLADLLPDANVLEPAAVLVGLVPRGEALSVVLTLRNSDLRQHAGQVSFPGGRAEPGDAGPAHTALREAHEETAIPPALVQPLGWLDPLATITGFRIAPLVARLSPDIAPVADPREVDEVFEVPLAHLLATANLTYRAIEYRGAIRHVTEYLPYQGGPRIWGATAMILGNLVDRLGGSGRPGHGRIH